MITKVSVPQGLVENNDDGIATIFSPMVITINAFGEYSASQFAASFNSVTNSPQKYILISVNSPGGSVFELNQMRDLIVNSEKPVIGFGGGMVFSAASILLTSCTKGHRWMSPSSKLMIHEVATSSEGKSSDIISDALETEKLNDELFEILAKNAGKPKMFFKNLIKKKNNSDFFLSAEECLAYGLVDKVGIPEVKMNVSVDWEVRDLVVKHPVKVKKEKAAKVAKVAKAAKSA